MDIYQNFSEIDLTPLTDYIYAPGSCDGSATRCNKNKNFLFDTDERTSRPIMVRVEPVNICNNNCIICTKQVSSRKPVVMELSVFEKILHDYSAIGGGRISLTPTGGDVFLDPLLLPRLELLKKYPKIQGISFTTNAVYSDTCSDPDLSDVLSHFDRIHISVYGLDAEEYSLMTRRNTYSRMVEGIKRIIRLKKESTDLAIGFRLLKRRSNAELDSWLLSNFSSLFTYGFTHEYYNWGDGVICASPLPFDATWIPPVCNNTRCLYPLIACQIFSDGNVSFCPCEDYDGVDELNLGNIKKMTLREIINSEKNRALWDSSQKIPEFCKHCNAHTPFPSIDETNRIAQNPSLIFGA